MKSFFRFFFVFTGALLIGQIHTCPTCIGQIEKETPPFFNQVFDSQSTTTTTNKIAHIDQEIKRKNRETMIAQAFKKLRREQ